MTSSTKNSIIKGTFILTIAGIAARFLGFYNRIFLTDLFGARELGIYQMVFPVYMVIFSFCCQGIQTALTRQVARPDFDSMHSKVCLLRNALLLSVFLSLLSGIFVFFNAEWISLQLLHSRECTRCLQILCFAFPFVSVKGCITGYYIGIQRSGVTAWSQLLEQIAKIGGVFILSTFFLLSSPKAYCAVYGIVTGEIVSCLWTVFCYLRDRFHMHLSADTAIPTLHCRRELLHDALPLTANRLSLTALQSLETILIPHMLNLYFCNGDQALILYGTLTGMVLPCIMFPTTVTSSLATMLLPAISSEYQKEHTESLHRLIKKSLCFCLLIGVASTLFLLCFGNWAGQFLFQSEAAGALLFQFALLCPFIYLSACLSSIINGMGFATRNLFYSILGIGIRIAFILILVPRIGLTGYMWGMMLSYLLQTGLLLLCIRKKSLP